MVDFVTNNGFLIKCLSLIKGKGSRGWEVPLAVSILRSPSRLRVSPDDKEERSGCGRSGPHFIIFIHTIKSSTKAYNMDDKHQVVRRNHYHHHHCQLLVHGDGSQASKQGQNSTFGRTGKTFYRIFFNKNFIIYQIAIWRVNKQIYVVLCKVLYWSLNTKFDSVSPHSFQLSTTCFCHNAIFLSLLQRYVITWTNRVSCNLNVSFCE